MIDRLRRISGPLGPFLSVEEREQMKIAWLESVRLEQLPVLVRILGMKSEEITEEMLEQAAEGIVKIGQSDPIPALSGLKAALPNNKARTLAIEAMGQINHPAALDNLVEILDLYGGSSVEVLVALACAAGFLGSADAAAFLLTLESNFGHIPEVSREIQIAKGNR